MPRNGINGHINGRAAADIETRSEESNSLQENSERMQFLQAVNQINTRFLTQLAHIHADHRSERQSAFRTVISAVTESQKQQTKTIMDCQAMQIKAIMEFQAMQMKEAREFQAMQMKGIDVSNTKHLEALGRILKEKDESQWQRFQKALSIIKK